MQCQFRPACTGSRRTNPLLDREGHNLIPPNSWELSITALVGENSMGDFALDGIKIGGIQVTNGTRVADARQVDIMIECPAFMVLKGAVDNDGGFVVLFLVIVARVLMREPEQGSL
jgi:hypothetical protein